MDSIPVFQSNEKHIISIPGGSLDGFPVNQNPSKIIIKVRIHEAASITILISLSI